METYEIMRIGFFVCLAVAVLFFILSVLLFFMFDIRGILASRSGKTRAKTIREMEETNSTTGRLMPKKRTSNTTDNLDKNKVAVKKGTVLSPDQVAGSSITEKIRITEEIKKPADDAEQTAVLGADVAETAVLGADAEQTAVLGADSDQTAVLGADAAQTAVLGADADETDDLDGVTQRYGDSETTVLVESASVPAVDGVRFEIIKKMVICDTREIIE